jgi:hypothetical protein
VWWTAVFFRVRFHVLTATSVRTAFRDNLMLEAIRTSETSVCFYESTWRHIPDGYYLRRFCAWTPLLLNKTTYVLFFLLSLLSKLFSHVHICSCILKLQHMFMCRYKIETLRNFQWFRCWYPKRWILDLCHISHGPLNYVAGGFISLQ